MKKNLFISLLIFFPSFLIACSNPTVSSSSSFAPNSSSSEPNTSSSESDTPSFSTSLAAAQYYFPTGPYCLNDANSTFRITILSQPTSSANGTCQIDGYYASTLPKAQIVTISTLTYNNKQYDPVVIGANAFQHANALNKNEAGVGIRKITLPSTVTTLRKYAFKGLDLVTEIIIPDGSALTTIEEGAFSFCFQLAHLYLPNTVTSLPANCFYQDLAFGAYSYKSYALNNAETALTSTTVTYAVGDMQIGLYGKATPNQTTYDKQFSNLLSLRENAFAYCTSLASFTCPINLDFIDNYCFRNDTKLKTVTFPTYLRKIGDYAFQGCTGFTQTGASCDFSGCAYLEDVGISIFKDTDLVTTDTDGNTVTKSPSFIFSGIVNDVVYAPFFCAYNWAIAFDSSNTAAAYITIGATISISIPDSVTGLARDVLSTLPVCSLDSAPAGDSSDKVSKAKAVSVTINKDLKHASNNFIRQSGDDYNFVSMTQNTQVTSNFGFGFSRLHSPNSTGYTYSAITIDGDNSAFQVLNVRSVGTGNGTNNNSAITNGKFLYQHLVNYYEGYDPINKRTRAEAKLITCSRYAHWNATTTFQSLTATENEPVVASPEGKTIFTTSNGFNGNKPDGTVDADGYHTIQSYTTLSAQCGEGCVSFFNTNFSAYDTLSLTGKTTNNSNTPSESYACQNLAVSFDSADDYIKKTYFFASSTSYDNAVSMAYTLKGHIGTNASSIADVMTIFPLGTDGNILDIGSAAIALDSKGNFEKTGTLTFTNTTSTVSGLELKATTLNGPSINVYSLDATLTYSGTTTVNKTETSFKNSSSEWTYSGPTLFSSTSKLNDHFAFGPYVRRIEDHVMEGYCTGSNKYFLIRSSVEYVGRDLTSGNILLMSDDRKGYYYLQDAIFNEDWSRYLGIMSTYAGNEKDPVAVESTSYFWMGTTGTLNGQNVWSIL